jgi:hypothetical protein
MSVTVGILSALGAWFVITGTLLVCADVIKHADRSQAAFFDAPPEPARHLHSVGELPRGPYAAGYAWPARRRAR